MLEDKVLVWKLKRGSTDALRRIYQKYKSELMGLGMSLSNNNRAVSEDAVHDVFVAFAEIAKKLQLRGSLKSYLLTCVANRVRSMYRAKQNQTVPLDDPEIINSDCDGPDELAVLAEQSEYISHALAGLPYDQREVMILHLQGGLTFKAIAQAVGVSVSTAQSRYRYAADKLRPILSRGLRE